MRKKMQGGSFKFNDLNSDSSSLVRPLGIKSAVSIQNIPSSRFRLSINNEPKKIEITSKPYSKQVKEGKLTLA